ncbi:hypothetical protein Ate01nite_57110 [Actinoplanes teichomyceticus]|nr:hypothetical protein Ate01nite_57110 [Actinoplanes teichomyceticus]
MIPGQPADPRVVECEVIHIPKSGDSRAEMDGIITVLARHHRISRGAIEVDRAGDGRNATALTIHPETAGEVAGPLLKGGKTAALAYHAPETNRGAIE